MATSEADWYLRVYLVELVFLAVLQVSLKFYFLYREKKALKKIEEFLLEISSKWS